MYFCEYFEVNKCPVMCICQNFIIQVVVNGSEYHLLILMVVLFFLLLWFLEQQKAQMFLMVRIFIFISAILQPCYQRHHMAPKSWLKVHISVARLQILPAGPVTMKLDRNSPRSLRWSINPRDLALVPRELIYLGISIVLNDKCHRYTLFFVVLSLRRTSHFQYIQHA